MNILLTSAGRRSYMIKYFKDALGSDGQVYASNSMYTYTLSLADGYVISPYIYDNNYIDFIFSYCKKNAINCVIPLFDIDLPILSLNKDMFESNGIKIIVSDYEKTLICNDKWLTYNFLSSIGIRQKLSFINLNEILKRIEDGLISFPIVVKPRWGMGSIGIYIVDNLAELKVIYHKLKNDIFKTYLRFESEKDKDECIIMQEYINGQEYGIEILNDLNNNYVTTFAKKKVAMRSGETDIAETVHTDKFIDLAKNISCNLKHRSILDVDCIEDNNENIYVIEMNCRFGGQYPFTHNSGVNVPKQIIQWVNGLPTNLELLTQKNGVRSCKEIVPVVIENN